MTKPTVTYRYNKRRMRLTALMLIGVALVFALGAVLAHWSLALVWAFAMGMSAYTLVLAARDEPVLAIGPEGLRFTRFSARTVPWSEITAVAVVRGVWRSQFLGRESAGLSTYADAITVTLKNYDGYSGALRNALRGLRAALGLPGVECHIWHMDGARVDDVARAIHAHWPGVIQDMITRRRGAGFQTTPWTGTPPPLD